MNNEIKVYSLENEYLKVNISNLGGALLNLYIKNLDDRDIVLGHKNLEDYITNPGNLGVIVGRNANRIEDATVTINHIKYDLEVNHFHNNLHTGSYGLQFKYFDVKQDGNTLTLMTTVKHLEDGFPGNLNVTITYTLKDHSLRIDYKAISDMDTVVNMTNHSYFNLNGQDNSTIYNHNLRVNSNFYMPNNEFSMPTKSICNNVLTPFDFSEMRNLKEALESDSKQIKFFSGLDHNFLINNDEEDYVAQLETNDLSMIITSDVNAMHIYTANHFPDDSTLGKNNKVYPLHGGIAFETQISPNAMNMPWMKSPLLKANETFNSYTEFTIKVKD